MLFDAVNQEAEERNADLVGSTSKRRADHDRTAGGLCKRSAAMIPFDTEKKKVTAGAWFSDISLNYLPSAFSKYQRDGFDGYRCLERLKMDQKVIQVLLLLLLCPSKFNLIFYYNHYYFHCCACASNDNRRR